MVKVKIFAKWGDYHMLELQVTEFIQVVDEVIEIQYSTTNEGDMAVFSVMIVYRMH